MKKILDSLRKKPTLYKTLKEIYGNTFGLWWLKTLYLRYVGAGNGKNRLKLLRKKDVNNILSEKLKSGEPFMYARYGSSEFRAIMNEKDFPLVCFYSGFFPEDIRLREKFKKVYLGGMEKIDILGLWNYRNHFLRELKLIRKFPNLKYLARTFEVGDIKNPWLKSLKGKKVLVINDHKTTIETQNKKREKLGILPKIKSLDVIRAVQTSAGNPDPRFKTWFEALEWMKKEIDKKDFDVAIIGCGAYGLPLAAYIREKGKQAIHLAGSTQLLFGIKGKRWDNDPSVKYNKHWISTMKEDIFTGHDKIEGGCYW